MTILLAVLAGAQMSGKAAHDAFATWRKVAAVDDWDTAIARYRAKLKTDGLEAPASKPTTKACGTTRSTPPPQPSTPNPTVS
jgi:hypothetical protein